MKPDPEKIKRAGLEAAARGAEVLRSFFGNITSVTKKGKIDLVTEADIHAEKIILKTLQSHFPDHGILAEESGHTNPKSPEKWIVDPLDGTTNFAHGLPVFAVSIAFAFENDIQFGCVLNPISNERYTACRGEGATFNGKPISVSKNRLLENSLLATGFPYNIRESAEQIIRRLRCLLTSARGIRRLGAASIDICLVASGVFDGFWEENLRPWDTAAGVLIAAEAGASITDFSNRPYALKVQDLDKKEILVTNGRIHGKMAEKLQVSVS